MILARRRFFGLFVAPAIVRATSLMAISSLAQQFAFRAAPNTGPPLVDWHDEAITIYPAPGGITKGETITLSLGDDVYNGTYTVTEVTGSGLVVVKGELHEQVS